MEWCSGRDSNPHSLRPRDFKSLASTNFATRASLRYFRSVDFSAYVKLWRIRRRCHRHAGGKPLVSTNFTIWVHCNEQKANN